ncbi:/ rplO / 50S ribosomal protein L15 /:428083 Reverse [Candidatus Hepatoplasma crinochetorum]|uniref:Large ribosomal subunit protein uL15 n=1 Tax=Candidatus Hepatoplasma crinochetorum TaxID=295596 RepID=A0A0G7ZN53_9MOLU|nr:/ rplO / 50S ribosomal protein L15 /:428083 Reverse [Candidatus Hepatoplasma crinochetorum]
MKLEEMKSTPGSRKDTKRVGRGDKTAGRGENGQKSRAGYSKKIGFEGGQNPLYKRIPKRGFNNINHIEYTVINVDKFVRIEGDKITPEILIEHNIIKSNYGFLKILGYDKLLKAYTVTAHKFSEGAKKAIEEAGGKVVIIKMERSEENKGQNNRRERDNNRREQYGSRDNRGSNRDGNGRSSSYNRDNNRGNRDDRFKRDNNRDNKDNRRENRSENKED